MKIYTSIVICSLICFSLSAQKGFLNNQVFEGIPAKEYIGKYYNFIFDENYSNEFEEDPVKFINDFMNAQDFQKKFSKGDFSGVELVFRTSESSLKAAFNNKGKIIRTFHRCRNIWVPNNVKEEIHQNYNGWAVVKSIHIAKGRGGKIENEFFKIKLTREGKVKRIKIPISEHYNRGIVGH